MRLLSRLLVVLLCPLLACEDMFKDTDFFCLSGSQIGEGVEFSPALTQAGSYLITLEFNGTTEQCSPNVPSTCQKGGTTCPGSGMTLVCDPEGGVRGARVAQFTGTTVQFPGPVPEAFTLAVSRDGTLLAKGSFDHSQAVFGKSNTCTELTFDWRLNIP